MFIDDERKYTKSIKKMKKTNKKRYLKSFNFYDWLQVFLLNVKLIVHIYV